MSILKKTIIIIITSYLSLSPVFATQKTTTIAITQITSHPSLDQVRIGILDALHAAGYNDNNTDILFENAQGSIPCSVQIAQKFVAKNPDIVIAIGTPSAQALKKAIAKRPIPLVFSSITDPVGAGLIDSLDTLPRNDYAVGTRNIAPIETLLKTIIKIMPHLKTIGIVYNPSEKNSIEMLKILKTHANNHNITIIESSTTTTANVSMAVQKIVSTVDACILLQDNTVASALPVYLKIALNHKKPVFSLYPEAVEQGALMAIACNEYTIGLETGKIAISILHGKDPRHIPVKDSSDINIYLNLPNAKTLQIDLSDDLIKQSSLSHACYPTP